MIKSLILGLLLCVSAYADSPVIWFGSQGKIISNGGLLSPSGSTVLPSYGFNESPFTGIYSPGTDVIGFLNNSTERMRLDSSGRLGIGVTPTQNLDILNNLRVRGLTTSGAVLSDSTGLLSSVNPLPAANGGSSPVTKTLYVDNGRTDSFTADGSVSRPFATISAAVSKIISNGDNATNAYTVYVAAGGYNETVTLSNALLYSVAFISPTGATINHSGSTVISSTANNTNLGSLVFDNFTINGEVNLTGDINNTNFCSSQCIFQDVNFNVDSGSTGITLNNVNNVSFIRGQVQGGSTHTWTNVAFAFLEGDTGWKNGETLNLVQNNSANQPSQTFGNYFLMTHSQFYAAISIDAGSEMDALENYFGSGSSVVNNGTIHSWGSQWNGTETLNSGSATRVQGDTFLSNPTVNAGATLTNRGWFNALGVTLGTSAVSKSNDLLLIKDGHVASNQTTAPTTTTNAHAGTGASSSVSHATDQAGLLSLTTGSASLASGLQASVNFNAAYNAAPICLVTPNNTAAAGSALGVYVTSSTSALQLNFSAAGSSLSTFVWNYQCIETQ